VIEELQKKLPHYHDNSSIHSCLDCGNKKIYAHLGAGFRFCKVQHVFILPLYTCSKWKKADVPYDFCSLPYDVKLYKQPSVSSNLEKLDDRCCVKCTHRASYGCDKLTEVTPEKDKQKYSDEDRMPSPYDCCDFYDKSLVTKY
jgi:hypothetical protein